MPAGKDQSRRSLGRDDARERQDILSVPVSVADGGTLVDRRGGDRDHGRARVGTLRTHDHQAHG